MAKEPLQKNPDNKKYRSTGRSITGFNTDLDIDVPAGLVPYKKELPAGLPEKTKSGKSITWFNNFGVMHSTGEKNGQDLKKDEKITYKVTLKRPPNAPNKERRKICIYDESLPGNPEDQVVEINEHSDSNDEDIVIELNLGDPPSGLFP